MLCAKGRAPIRLKALLCAACSVPRPQFVRQIDEIWGVRCACRVCALACPDLTSHPCGRYANLAELSEEDRENKLEVGKRSQHACGVERARPRPRAGWRWSGASLGSMADRDEEGAEVARTPLFHRWLMSTRDELS